MGYLRGIEIKNYRVFRHISLGQISWNVGNPLPNLCVFMGRNGCGKSTLLDVFSFLGDCLREGVQSACDKPHRRGFESLRSKECLDPISFKIYYQKDNESPITYELFIDCDKSGSPFVAKESLKQRRVNMKTGQSFPFLLLKRGKGWAWTGKTNVSETDDEIMIFSKYSTDSEDRVEVNLERDIILGIRSLGQLKEHPRIREFSTFISDWHLSYLVPDHARFLSMSGPQKYMDSTGSNMGNVLQHIKRNYPKVLDKICKELSRWIPRIRKVDVEETIDKRVVMRFFEDFVDPTFQMDTSDGTLKFFAYLLLLLSPQKRSFIGIEEPENSLYPDVQSQLARMFKKYTSTSKGFSSQIFVTTHSPYFLEVSQHVWIFSKDVEGFVSCHLCEGLKEL